MDARRYKPFRKRPPMRRRAQLRRRRRLVEYDDVLEEYDEYDEPAEYDEPEQPAPPEQPVDLDDVEEPDERPAASRGGRWALVAGTTGMLAAAVVAGVVILTGGSGPAPNSPAPQAVVFRPPRTVVDRGELVRTRVLTSGDLRVDHWIRSMPLSSALTVRVPAVPGLDSSKVRVEGLLLDADGVAQRGRATPSHPHRFSFLASSTVHVRYTLHGVTQPSGSGTRAVVRLTALDLSVEPAPATRTAVVEGARVLALACSGPQTMPEPCGTAESRGRWSADLGAGPDPVQVLAQVELGSS